ncbi:MAG: hypothetical protein J1E34_03830 [Oscillospiraceae bacterium]|nr:hypothetical protein [Oscillospiraceae bacterium]
MEEKKKNKYPANLFRTGFFMNMIKNFYLLFPAIILLIVGIWVKWCLFLGLALLALDIIISLAEQLQIRNAALNSSNPNFKKWQDAILSPNWKDNIINLTESRIESSEEDNSDNSPS